MSNDTQALNYLCLVNKGCHHDIIECIIGYTVINGGWSRKCISRLLVMYKKKPPHPTLYLYISFVMIIRFERNLLYNNVLNN